MARIVANIHFVIDLLRLQKSSKYIYKNSKVIQYFNILGSLTQS